MKLTFPSSCVFVGSLSSRGLDTLSLSLSTSKLNLWLVVLSLYRLSASPRLLLSSFLPVPPRPQEGHCPSCFIVMCLTRNGWGVDRGLQYNGQKYSPRETYWRCSQRHYTPTMYTSRSLREGS